MQNQTNKRSNWKSTRQRPKAPPPSAISYDWSRVSSINFCLTDKLTMPWLMTDSRFNDSNCRIKQNITDLHLKNNYKDNISVNHKRQMHAPWRARAPCNWFMLNFHCTEQAMELRFLFSNDNSRIIYLINRKRRREMGTWSNKEGFNWALNSRFESFKPLLKALLFSSLHLQRSPSSIYSNTRLTRSNSAIISS